MGRLIVSTQMTLDGVIEATGDWAVPEGEHDRHGFEQLLAAEALLLGRKTYQGLAAHWSAITGDQGWADRLNPMPKFVVSRTLREPLRWNATLVEGNASEGVRDLKARLEGDLLMYGCGGLARHLARRGLVDEVRLWVHPVVQGVGDRLFHDGGPVPLTLLGSTSFDSGVTLLRYRPKDSPVRRS